MYVDCFYFVAGDHDKRPDGWFIVLADDTYRRATSDEVAMCDAGTIPLEVA